MTTPKGWDTAEAARLHQYGHGHDLACTNAPCSCKVLYPVRARTRDLVVVGAEEYDSEYHGEVGHILESATAPASCSPRRRGRSRISRSNR